MAPPPPTMNPRGLLPSLTHTRTSPESTLPPHPCPTVPPKGPLDKKNSTTNLTKSSPHVLNHTHSQDSTPARKDDAPHCSPTPAQATVRKEGSSSAPSSRPEQGNDDAPLLSSPPIQSLALAEEGATRTRTHSLDETGRRRAGGMGHRCRHTPPPPHTVLSGARYYCHTRPQAAAVHGPLRCEEGHEEATPSPTTATTGSETALEREVASLTSALQQRQHRMSARARDYLLGHTAALAPVERPMSSRLSSCMTRASHIPDSHTDSATTTTATATRTSLLSSRVIQTNRHANTTMTTNNSIMSCRAGACGGEKIRGPAIVPDDPPVMKLTDEQEIQTRALAAEEFARIQCKRRRHRRTLSSCSTSSLAVVLASGGGLSSPSSSSDADSSNAARWLEEAEMSSESSSSSSSSSSVSDVQEEHENENEDEKDTKKDRPDSPERSASASSLSLWGEASTKRAEEHTPPRETTLSRMKSGTAQDETTAMRTDSSEAHVPTRATRIANTNKNSSHKNNNATSNNNATTNNSNTNSEMKKNTVHDEASRRDKTNTKNKNKHLSHTRRRRTKHSVSFLRTRRHVSASMPRDETSMRTGAESNRHGMVAMMEMLSKRADVILPDPQAALPRRGGDVLTSQHILMTGAVDARRCRGGRTGAIAHAPFLRVVPKLHIAGVAQPHKSAIRAIVNALRRSDVDGCVVWFNVREDPIIYIHDEAFVVRAADDPHTPVIIPNVTGRNVEAMEAKLKLEVLHEAYENGGNVSIYVEDSMTHRNSREQREEESRSGAQRDSSHYGNGRPLNNSRAHSTTGEMEAARSRSIGFGAGLAKSRPESGGSVSIWTEAGRSWEGEPLRLDAAAEEGGEHRWIAADGPAGAVCTVADVFRELACEYGHIHRRHPMGDCTHHRNSNRTGMNNSSDKPVFGIRQGWNSVSGAHHGGGGGSSAGAPAHREQWTPILQYHRLPFTHNMGPQPTDFDRVLEACLEEPTALLVFNCQTGRGRTSAAMQMASIVRFYQRAVKDVSMDVRLLLSYHHHTDALTFRTIQKLVSLFPDGKLHERRLLVLMDMTDEFYSMVDHIRAAFADYRAGAAAVGGGGMREGEETKSVAAMGQQDNTALATMRLQMYALFLVFSYYCEQRLWNLATRLRFSEWLSENADIAHLIAGIRSKLDYQLRQECVAATAAPPPPPKEQQQQRSVDAGVCAGVEASYAKMIRRRRGNVLSRGRILCSAPMGETRHGVHHTSHNDDRSDDDAWRRDGGGESGGKLVAVHALRQLAPDVPLFTCGRLLGKTRAQVLHNIRSAFTQATRLHWISLRAEPMVVINGVSYTLHNADTNPSVPVTMHVTLSAMEQMEERLRRDVLLEAQENEGLVLLHTLRDDDLCSSDEDGDDSTKSKKRASGLRECCEGWQGRLVRVHTVRTPRALMDEFVQSEGIDYQRIPIPLSGQMRLRNLDPLLRLLYSGEIAAGDVVVINDSEGALRTSIALNVLTLYLLSCVIDLRSVRCDENVWVALRGSRRALTAAATAAASSPLHDKTTAFDPSTPAAAHAKRNDALVVCGAHDVSSSSPTGSRATEQRVGSASESADHSMPGVVCGAHMASFMPVDADEVPARTIEVLLASTICQMLTAGGLLQTVEVVAQVCGRGRRWNILHALDYWKRSLAMTTGAGGGGNNNNNSSSSSTALSQRFTTNTMNSNSNNGYHGVCSASDGPNSMDARIMGGLHATRHHHHHHHVRTTPPTATHSRSRPRRNSSVGLTKEQRLTHALHTLRDYLMVLLSAIYMDSQGPCPNRMDFSVWVEQLAGVRHIIDTLESRGEAALRYIAADNLMRADLSRRRGDVLTANFGLKADHFPGCQKKGLRPELCGAPNFRKVNYVNVYGVAIPTLVGVHNVLTLLGASSSSNFSSHSRRHHDDRHRTSSHAPHAHHHPRHHDGAASVSSSSSTAMWTYPGQANDSELYRGFAAPRLFDRTFRAADLQHPLRGSVVWVNLREEPILYVGDRPFVFRDLAAPYVNVELTGIATEKIEEVENRLRHDVLVEAQEYNGKFLVHDENRPGELVGRWEAANEDSVKTLREVYDDLLDRHYRCHMLRLPVTDEQSPTMENFDQLVVALLPRIVEHVDRRETLSFVFNCQMGRGRTTTGMVVCCLLIGLVMPEYYGVLESAYGCDGVAGASRSVGRASRPGLLSRHASGVHMNARRSRTSSVVQNSNTNSSYNSNNHNNNNKSSERVLLYPPDASPLSNGEYEVIRQLKRVLVHGREAKTRVDLVLESCSHMQNLRTAIESFVILAASPDSTEEGRARAHHAGVHYLIRYFSIIAFDVYLHEKFNTVDKRMRCTFVQWMELHPELTTLIESCTLK